MDARPPNESCLAPAKPGLPGGIALTPTFTGQSFWQPVQMTRARLSNTSNEYDWLIVSKDGQVRQTSSPEATSSRMFLDVDATDTSAGGRVESTCYECGLLGVALDPAYTTNHRVYVNYTSNKGCSAGFAMCSYLSRFTVTESGGNFVHGPEEVLWKIDKPESNHNGGALLFGADGMLYLSMGDGGGAGDFNANAQNLSKCLGKILRFDVNATQSGLPFRIPNDNPFMGTCGSTDTCCQLSYAYGLRNPWRMSLDRTTGRIWIGDVGQDAWEEANLLERGANYGWRCYEGVSTFSSYGACASPITHREPEIEYSNNIGSRQAIVGGFVYRGSALPSLVGKYVFADFGSGEVWAIANPYDINGSAAGTAHEPAALLSSGRIVSSIAEDEQGELYFMSLYGGPGDQVVKLTATSNSTNTLPLKLSQTGCFNPSAPHQPASGVIPYEPNAQLWSDGANKRRWLALPNNARITVLPNGEWDLPNGSVLIKEFSIGSVRAETRFFVRHADGDWSGYTYRWNAEQTDADLLDTRVQAPVNGQTWTFPSRGDCMSCHTEAAGRVLGLETAQLNRAITYPASGRTDNQLRTLGHLNMFTSTMPAHTTLPAYAEPFGTRPVAERARAYLHANCSNCHREGGGAVTPPNLLHSNTFAQMGICNATPQRGTLGITNARLLTPGLPASSLMSVRLHTTGPARMPPLGGSVVDTAGTALIDSWINSLTSCP